MKCYCILLAKRACNDKKPHHLLESVLWIKVGNFGVSHALRHNNNAHSNTRNEILYQPLRSSFIQYLDTSCQCISYLQLNCIYESIERWEICLQSKF